MNHYRVYDEFPAIKKLNTFRDLPAGWHYGSGGPISDEVLLRAGELVRILGWLGFTRSDAFANEDGDVLVTAYHRQHYISIGVALAGTYTLNHEIDGVESFYGEGMNIGDLVKELSKVSKAIWNTSGSSTHQSSTTTPENSMIWHLKKAPKGAACQSSKWTARALALA